MPDEKQTIPDMFETPDVLPETYIEAFAALPTIVFLYDLNTKRNIFLNSRFHETVAYTPERQSEHEADLLTHLLHPEDAPRLSEAWKQFESPTPSEVTALEFRVRYASGEWLWLAGRARVFKRTEDGRPHHILCTVDDISEHKAARKEERSDNTPFQALLDTAASAIVSIDEEGTVENFNRSAERMFGYSPEEVIGQNIKMLMPAPYHDEHDGYLQNYRDTGEKKIIGIGREVRGQRKDGSTFPLDLAVSEAWVGRRVFLGIMRDLTAEHQIEASLHESELRLQQALKNAKQGLWDWNLVTGEVYRDVNWANLIGFSPEELDNRHETWLERIHPDDKARLLDVLHRHLENAEVDYDADFRILHKSGKWLWVNTRGAAQRDTDGKPVRLVGTTQDITARKKAEEEWTYLREHARCLIWYAEVRVADEADYLIWDQEFPSLGAAQHFLPLDVPSGSTYSKAFYAARFPEDRARCDAHGIAAVRAGQSYEQEYRQYALDGSVRWLHEDVYVETIKEGKQWRMVSVCTDITATKQAEAALRESQQRLQAIFDNALDAIVMTTDERRFLAVNAAACTLLGYDRAELLALPDTRTLTEDQAGNGFRQLLEEGNLNGMTRMKRKDGSLITVEYNAVANVLPGIHLSIFHDVTEREQMMEALRESETRFRSLADSAPVLIWEAGLDTLCNYFNQTWLDFTGKTLEEELGDGWADGVHPDDRQACIETYLYSFEKREPFRMEYRLRYHDGTYHWLLDVGAPRFSPDGTFQGYIGTCVDINDRKVLQEQLFESQKLESMGRLAGGIAHDFNNLLTAILGYTELSLTMLPEDSEVRHFLDNVSTAGQRAADLTKQLLMYARRQMVDFTILDMNKIILGMDSLLRRTMGEQYELVTVLTEEACHVRANGSQMEQVLMNLVVNARDAMPEGGRISIETACVTLDEDYARHHVGVAPGDYVLYSVSDTGTGMPADVRNRIFEPFFTTKEVGKGTGLGLATCYGIVKQSSGNIWVYSEPGQGTTFKVYLPLVRTETPNRTTKLPDDMPAGTETILLVDDEPMVRDIAARTLRSQGYRVLAASNGAEALHLQSEWQGEIDLLLTDVVMPLMGGKELAQRLQELHPDLKVLYMSGYTQNVVLQQGIFKPGILLLTKPFTAAGLSQKVREALTASPLASAPAAG